MTDYSSRSGNSHYRFRHGLSGGKSRLYGIWQAMLNRCRNPKTNSYVNYGGRGIRVCEDWHRFDAFQSWAKSNGYEDGLSIERDNINGNYCPENCRWIPKVEQSLNTRRTVWVIFEGQRINLKQASACFDIPYSTMCERARRGKLPPELEWAA